MGMTMTQKILAAHSGGGSVSAGELILARADLVLGNDITAPVAIKEFSRLGCTDVFDKEKIVMVMDHFAPNKDIKAAGQCSMCRGFCSDKGITHFYDVGQMGVEHALLPEQGLVTAGALVIGADSHTCTYGALGAFSAGVGSTDMACAMATGKVWLRVPSAIKVELVGKPRRFVGGKDVILHLIGKLGVDGALYRSLEFCGEGVSCLGMSDRLCIANMAVEAGAKNGVFPVDETTLDYLGSHGAKEPVSFSADPDACYETTIRLDLSALEPTVAFPHLPENAKTFSEFGEIRIDQVVIGSCTNGRLEDLRTAAQILKGRKCAAGVRAIVIPATQRIYLEALREGLIETFIESGCAVSTPTCGPCLGGHMGILARGESAVATTNRNFVGRMGDPDSKVYLASPAVAAASALTGRITSPWEIFPE